MAKDVASSDGLDRKEMGAKLDLGKPLVYKGVLGYFPSALRAIAKLSETGAEKYQWNGWSAVDNAQERYLEADARHLFDLADPNEPDFDLTYDEAEFNDLEEGRLFYHHHLVAHAWNALAALEQFMRGGGRTEYIEHAPRKAKD